MFAHLNLYINAAFNAYTDYTIGHIPIGYRPTKELGFNVPIKSGYIIVRIAVNGDIIISTKDITFTRGDIVALIASITYI